MRNKAAPASSALYGIINGLMFNITWFAIVTTQSSLLAPALVGLHLLAHFGLMGRGKAELQLVAGVTIFGAVVDQVLFRVGIFTLAGHPALAPLWLTCLWPVLATTFMHAFSALQQRMPLAAVLGAIGGVASYTAGTRLTEVEFGSALWAPVTIAVLWGIIFPLLLKVAAKAGSLTVWTPVEQR